MREDFRFQRACVSLYVSASDMDTNSNKPAYKFPMRFQARRHLFGVNDMCSIALIELVAVWLLFPQGAFGECHSHGWEWEYCSLDETSSAINYTVSTREKTKGKGRHIQVWSIDMNNLIWLMADLIVDISLQAFLMFKLDLSDHDRKSHR